MSAAAPRAISAEMTAGRYLQLRRESARVSLPEAARAYAFTPIGASSAEMLLGEVERDLVVLGEPGLRRLQARFLFDACVYLALAGEVDAPVPSICRLCACTWDDACPGGCAWAGPDETICTACAEIVRLRA